MGLFGDLTRPRYHGVVSVVGSDWIGLDRVACGLIGSFRSMGAFGILAHAAFTSVLFFCLLMLCLQDGLRPVIYYLEHLVRDTDETKTFSRALISFVKYNNPKTIMHPILVFVLEVLWTHLAPWHEADTQIPHLP